MKTIRNTNFLKVIISVLLLCLSTCTPTPNSVDPQNSSTQEGLQVTVNPTGMVDGTDPARTQLSTPESQQVTPEVAPTSLPTNTPEPSPTTRPHYEINDPATWPQEMQDYFNRAPEEWNNQVHSYMSDEVFNTQLIQMRRDFIQGIGLKNDESMGEYELFIQYLKWGQDNKQLLTLSPEELRTMLTDPNNEGVAYKHIFPDNSGMVMYEGLFAMIGIQDNDTLFQNRINNVLNSEMNLTIFGVNALVHRGYYRGVRGDQIGAFRLPGVDPSAGVGVLVHYINDSGIDCYMPLIAHFIDLQVNKGDIVVVGGNIGGPSHSPVEAVMAASHVNPSGRSDMRSITLEEIVNNLGNKVTIYADTQKMGEFEEFFPWGFGLEPGDEFSFYQWTDPATVLPWTEP